MGAVLPVASRKRVTARCTGSPTSTFGGGGGTKLFCSQALNATHANMTKKPRDTAISFCECEGIIPVSQSWLVLETYWFGRKIFAIPA
jgi:hypothetical protein